jgi:Tol biopolymer transport system component
MRQYCLIALLILILANSVKGQDAVCDTPELLYLAANEDGYSDIFVTDTTGENTRNLTNDNIGRAFPQWSPDGEQIVFTVEADLNQSSNTLTIMHADSSNQRDLYIQGINSNPLWSPNGEYIAFYSTADGPLSVYVINADGTNPRRLNVGWLAEDFAWSPDSQYLAIQAQDETSHRDIYLVAVETGNAKRLTHDLLAATAPSWTPNNEITFSAFKERSSEILILDPFDEQAGLPQVFLSISTGAAVKWSPISQANAAVVIDLGDIWLYREGQLTNLTDDADDVLWLDWSPDGRFLAYTFLNTASGFSMGIKILEVETQEIILVIENADLADWRPCN